MTPTGHLPAHRAPIIRAGSARRGRREALPGWVRPLAGMATVAALTAVGALAISAFRGDFHQTVPVTVLTDRAGLVMNPQAKVKMYGAQVGSVASIEERPGGRAAIHLAMDPDKLAAIPANVTVDIASSTVFGAKFVQFNEPADPDQRSMFAGQVLSADHVTVELNTVFQQLTTLLKHIQPEKLNETLGAISTAMHGRGEQFGQTASDLQSTLAEIEPGLPALRADLAMAPTVFGAYADAADDLVAVTAHSARISESIVDKEAALDSFLVALTGFAQVGEEVVGENRQPLTDVLHLLVPTTALTAEYAEALTCGIQGLAVINDNPSTGVPGLEFAVNFLLGADRYRYPTHLPKVAGSGGPVCGQLPNIPYQTRVPFVVTDIGANPFEFGNQGLVPNTDALKQALFGPLPGPPRNTAEIGHPG